MLGLILRLDASGLGSQSRLMLDLLDPAAVVAVDMGADSRGPTVPPPDGALVLGHRPGKSIDAARQAARHLSGCDAVWSPESPYWPRLPRMLDGRMHLTVNPELWRDLGDRCKIALPTTWHSMQLGYPVVPHPTPFDQPGWADVRQANESRVGPARRVLHIAAPAFHDRNGTDAVLQGLAGYAGPGFTLLVAGAGLDKPTRGRPVPGLPLPATLGRDGQIRVERVGEVADRLDLYRDVDLLVLPRRYAGLCLPAQEAASAGVPVLMSDLDPQDGWSGVDSSIRCGRGHVVPMRGGRFRVAHPDPRSLAQRVWAYTQDDGAVRGRWQLQAVAWALAGSWPHVSDDWTRWLTAPV